MSWKRVYQWSVLAAFFFAVGFSYKYHLPRLESWALVKVEQLTETHSPVRVWAQKLKFQLFPFGIVLQDVRIKPNGSLARIVAPANLKEVGISLSFFSLLQGKLRVGRLAIRDSELSLFLDGDQWKGKSSGPSKKKISLKFLSQIPVDELDLEHVTVQGRVQPQNLVFRIADLNMSLENRYQSLFLEFKSPNVLIKPSGSTPPFNLQVETRIYLAQKELRVSALKFRKGDSFLVASGAVSGDILNGKFESGQLASRSHFDLASIPSWLKVLPNPPKLPDIAGTLGLDLGIKYRGANLAPRISAEIEGDGLRIDKFKIGKVDIQADGNTKKVKVSRAVFSNDAGTIALGDTQLSIPDQTFSTVAHVKTVELKTLLDDIGVHHVPIHLDVKGDIPCQGTFKPEVNVQCQGHVDGSNLLVHAGGKDKKKKQTIVKAGHFSVDGSVTVDKEQVSYKATALLGKNSKGSSSGTISYKKGFHISYIGEHLDFSDIDDLADLKLEGTARVKGHTEGNAHTATFDMDIAAQKIWLEDFGLGNLKTNMHYKSNRLYFKNVEGQYGDSRYNGHMAIEFKHNQFALYAKLPFADLKDVRSLLHRRLPIPVATTGTGTAQLKAWGPLRVTEMNADLTSHFFRGTIAGENYDDIKADVKDRNGIVSTKTVRLTKSGGTVELKGSLKPAWDVDARLIGRGLRLEQSENIGRLGLDLQGQGDFTLTMHGPVAHPKMDLTGTLSKMVIGDAPEADSDFHLQLAVDHIAGEGRFLGSKVETKFNFPFEKTLPFAFQMKTNNWDFTNMFTLISKSARQLDFKTGLTMNVDLNAPEGGFWKSSGFVDVKNFFIKKGAENLASNGPMKLSFNDGVVTSENFSIAGGENYLKLHVNGLSQKHFNASLNGKTDLSLLGLFTPFISDLRGHMAVSLSLTGDTTEPNLSGSCYVENGYVKLRDFVHPFSNVRADLLFNQKTLALNAIRAKLGGGQITADGKIGFNGKGDYPVDVSGQFNDVSVNVPEGFRTHGSGTLKITGNKFPYTMGINYNVDGGDITSEFSTSSGSSVKASVYLPKVISEESFDPFNFNLDVQLKKPVKVDNSLVQSPVEGHVTVKGVPSRLVLNGILTPAVTGKVYFRDVPFDITSGYVEYVNAPPENPKIYLAANTRRSENILDENNRPTENQYEINLLVQGRAPDVQISLTSQPSLPERDIVSLLALGLTPDALDERRTSGQQAANTSTAIAGALLQKPVGRKLKDTLGVDVKVSSTQPTADTASTPQVTFTKQWTPKFGASASGTLEANPTSSVKLEYKMSRGLSVIGSWEGRDQGANQIVEKKDASPSVLGLDLEYKVQFK